MRRHPMLPAPLSRSLAAPHGACPTYSFSCRAPILPAASPLLFAAVCSSTCIHLRLYALRLCPHVLLTTVPLPPPPPPPDNDVSKSSFNIFAVRRAFAYGAVPSGANWEHKPLPLLISSSAALLSVRCLRIQFGTPAAVATRLTSVPRVCVLHRAGHSLLMAQVSSLLPLDSLCCASALLQLLCFGFAPAAFRMHQPLPPCCPPPMASLPVAAACVDSRGAGTSARHSRPRRRHDPRPVDPRTPLPFLGLPLPFHCLPLTFHCL